MGMTQGEFFGISPTGNHATRLGIELVHIAHGNIAEVWGLNDVFNMMQQLGVLLGRALFVIPKA